MIKILALFSFICTVFLSAAHSIHAQKVDEPLAKQVAETASGEEAFNRPLALKMEDVRGSVARKTLHVLAGAHLLPRSYIWGLADTIRTGMEGRGRQSKSAYYFLKVIATKLPLGLLALALSGLILLPMRRSPRSWRLPGLALIFLAALFLAALARGASSGGMRHALPVLVVLGVFGGMATVFAVSRWSRIARLMVAFAVVIDAASAVPRIRPWEYFNEIVGGPERAYLYFGDESVDIGQRRLDFVRYYRQHLEPAGEVPYLLYPMAPSEQRRRGVGTLGEFRTDSPEDIPWADVSGIFFLSAVHINRNPRYQVFTGVPPVGRIGNLLIYRGTFRMPWLRERQLLVRAHKFRTSPAPDLDKAEALFREVLTINPNNFGALLTLGNLMLRKNQREEAVRFYERAREQLGSEDLAMRPVLTQQIQRLASNEPLERIPPVRGTREE